MPPKYLPQPARNDLIDLMDNLPFFRDNANREYVLNRTGLSDFEANLQFDTSPRLFCDHLIRVLEEHGLLNETPPRHALIPLLAFLEEECEGQPAQLAILREARYQTLNIQAYLTNVADLSARLASARPPAPAPYLAFRIPTITLKTGDDTLLNAEDTAILERLGEAQTIVIEMVFKKGLSGAKVFRADIVFAPGTGLEQYNGRNIIKIDRADLIEGEAAKHEAAANALPGSVPILLRKLTLPGARFAGVVYAIAGEYAKRIGTLADEPADGMTKRLRLLVEKVLQVWNKPDQIGRGHETPYDWVVKALNTGSTKNDRLAEVQALNLKRYRAAVAGWLLQVGGQFPLPPLPNPLYFARHAEQWPNQEIIIGPMGQVHGDLHGDNLICRVDEPARAPSLIDFARSVPNAPLYFDYAYLELDLLLRQYHDQSWAAWVDVLRSLTKNLVPTGNDNPGKGFAPLRKGVKSLIDGGGREKDDFARCWWLTAAGVGLLFARRESYEHDKRRLMALLYSAFMLNTAFSADLPLNSADVLNLEAVRFGPFSETLDLLTGTDLPEWLPVIGGTFTAGNPDPALNNPPHPVTLPDFLLATTPITHQQYARFQQATKHRQPKADDSAWDDPYSWGDWNPTPPANRLDHPVVYVSADDAQAYCTWLEGILNLPEKGLKGYRVVLPSADEWERAARGAEDRPFPCKSPTREYANFGGHYEGTTPVTQFPNGAGPYGHLDLAGNVWEITRTADGPNRILCGGCWDEASSPDTISLQSAFRQVAPPDQRMWHTGFRPAIIKGDANTPKGDKA